MPSRSPDCRVAASEGRGLHCHGLSLPFAGRIVGRLRGGFAGSAPTSPVWSGEMSAPPLGVALEAWDEDGRAMVEEVRGGDHPPDAIDAHRGLERPQR